MAEVATPEFKEYAAQIIKNAQALGAIMNSKHGEVFYTGGTDTHHLMWDLTQHGINGN